MFGNNIGIYKDKTHKSNDYTNLSVEVIDDEQLGVWSYKNDRVINGGNFYNEVYGAKHKNEISAPPIKPLLGSCTV